MTTRTTRATAIRPVYATWRVPRGLTPTTATTATMSATIHRTVSQLMDSDDASGIPQRNVSYNGTLMEGTMSRKFLTHSILVCALTFGMAAGGFAQSTSDEAKKAGKAAEKVGKDSAEAAEHAGKATAKTAKKTGKVIKKAVTPGSSTAL